MVAQGTKVGSAYISITGDATDFKKKLADLNADGKRVHAGLQSSIRQTNVETKGLIGSMTGLKASLIALASGMVYNSINDISDAFSLMRSRIRLVTQEGENLFDIEDKLARQAMTNRADLKETVGLYTRLRQSRADLSDAATQNLVDKWSKSLIISASSAQEAASSTQQFAQAMAAGVLSGQELRSVIQGNSAFAVYLAQSMGVTTGALKQMGEEGKLTTDVILEGLTKVGDHIEHDFAKKAMTIHQAMTNIETATIRLVGTIDQATGGSAGTAYWINQLAGAIENMTLYVRGSSPEIERLRAQTDKLNSTINETNDVVEKAALRDLGDQASDALPALGEVEAKIKAIKERMEETGAAGKARAIGKLEADILDQIIAIERLQNLLAAQKAPKMGGPSTTERRRTSADAREITNTEKAISDAQARLADAQKRLGELQGTPANDFRKPVDQQAVDILQTQLRLEVARAQGREKEVARLEDIIMSEKIIAEFKKQGLTTEEATAKAAAHVANLRKAINASNEKERVRAEAEATLRFQLAIAEAEQDKKRTAELEAQLEINRRAIELEEQGLDVAVARARATEEVTKIREAMTAQSEKELAIARELRDLEYQQALAASNGDEVKAKALQRELDIRRQIKELTDLGYEADQAKVIATQRVDALATDDNAWIGFEQRFSDAAKQGLMSAFQTGDWSDAFGEVLRDVLNDALSRAIDALWEALAQIDWGGKGSGFGGFFDMIGSAFAGNKAGGGDVMAGRKYRVGEMGSEWFVPKVDGHIIPHGAGGSLSAVNNISIGGTSVVVNGNADGVTVRQLSEVLDAHRRALPSMIDARVIDRQKRGAY